MAEVRRRRADVHALAGEAVHSGPPQRVRREPLHPSLLAGAGEVAHPHLTHDRLRQDTEQAGFGATGAVPWRLGHHVLGDRDGARSGLRLPDADGAGVGVPLG